MSELYLECKDQFMKLRASLKAKLDDGSLKLREIYQFAREFVETGTSIAKYIDVPGVEKKGLVVEAMMAWWHEPVTGLKAIDLPGPDSLFDPYIEAALPIMTGMLCNLVVRERAVTGWPEHGGV